MLVDARMLVLSAGDKCERLDGDGGALGGPVAVVEVVETTAEALPEDVGAAEGQAAVSAHGEAGGVDGTSLRWLVELELVVGRNVAGAANRVSQDAVAKTDLEGGVGLASNELVRGSSSGYGGACASWCLWLALGLH